MRLTVSVTEADIAMGKRGNCTRCPFAFAADRAIRLILPGLPVKHRGAAVVCSVNKLGRGPWHIDFFTLGFRFNIPTRCSKQVEGYEAGEPMLPTEFTIDLGDLLNHSPYLSPKRNKLG